MRILGRPTFIKERHKPRYSVQALKAAMHLKAVTTKNGIIFFYWRDY